MQHPAVPELAHTTTRPIHWVATATAISGVIALTSLLQPGAATAAQPQARTKADPVAALPPDPAKVRFPLDCGPTKILVAKRAIGDLDGDGRPETVAVVHCDASMGTPPDGAYVLTQAADATEPRVVATLVDPKDRLTVTRLAVHDGAVTASTLGYSSPEVPSCCPDVKSSAEWQWKGGAFIRSTPSGARTV
ncbi:hypothetical protein [Streptomyces sp. NPDC052036]|uniref:hypothetical protein n=1 Tax=unclassified Streptomyces TaxID=2593676 RepID=UPI0034169AD4